MAKKVEAAPKLSKAEIEEALSNELLGAVNAKLKDNNYKAAYYLSDPDINSDVKHWVSTGSSILDLAIANRPYGGNPVGRIVEYTGLEQCVHPDTKIIIRILD